MNHYLTASPRVSIRDVTKYNWQRNALTKENICIGFTLNNAIPIKINFGSLKALLRLSGKKIIHIKQTPILQPLKKTDDLKMPKVYNFFGRCWPESSRQRGGAIRRCSIHPPSDGRQQRRRCSGESLISFEPNQRYSKEVKRDSFKVAFLSSNLKRPI